MIILGLGSNIGDRIGHLRRALAALMQLPQLTIKQVSPLYMSDAQLPNDAPTDWQHSFLNVALSCESTLSPIELLAATQKIELQLGRAAQRSRWSPRVIDIDILAWGNQTYQSETLSIPHPALLQRPFALWPLADLAPLWLHPQHQLTAEQLCEPFGSRYDGAAPFHTRQIPQRIDTPRIVGVINVTPDSFSDGGLFAAAETALQQARHLVAAGADVLDIGAESTNPQSTSIGPEKEWLRLQPFLECLQQIKHEFSLTPLISVDTLNPDVAAKSLDYGVDWINDVTGFSNPAMRDVVRHTKVDCVIMHHLSIPPRRNLVLPQNKNPVDALLAWGEKHINALEKDGITRERMIIDPGISFGKTPGQSLTILREAYRFANLGIRVLIGHSRKSYMGAFTPYPAKDRDIETVAISQLLARQPIDYLRVHNVDLTARAFRTEHIAYNAYQLATCASGSDTMETNS